MKIVTCGPFLSERMEQMITGASPAAGKFLRNMNNGFIQLGIDTSIASYITAPIDKNELNLLKNLVATETGIYVFKGAHPIKSWMKYRASILKTIDKGSYVIIYNSVYPTLGLVRRILKKGAHPVLMLADFTEPYEYKKLVRKAIA
jgi:hypothetical protein